MALRGSRIDAEDAHLAGEESQLLQRQADRLLRRMAVDVGIELGDGEGAVDDIALELGDVDAVGGEAASALYSAAGTLRTRKTKLVMIGPCLGSGSTGSRLITTKRVVLLA